MAWPINPRPAKSLVVLRDQADALAPNRSKSDDGMLGDAAHASRTSDHNPSAAGVVCALDLTHDPAHGFNSYDFADTLRRNKDSRIKYLISNRRIAYGPRSPSHGDNPSSLWKWEPYSGSNPHDKHVHISVGDPRYYDKTDPWVLTGFPAPAPEPGPVSRPPLQKGSTGPFVASVQHTLGISVDSDFGPITDSAVRGYQAAAGIAVDGIVGPITWGKLDQLDAKVAKGDVTSGLPLSLVDQIELLAARSSLANHNFKDRGRAPQGFIAGMGCAFALAAGWLLHSGMGVTPAIKFSWVEKMSVPAGGPETDALAWYAPQFAAKGWRNDGGIDTLRHLFDLMIGLGMRESSGRYPEGRDTSASNVTGDTAEAGVFQMSWNLKFVDPAMGELFTAYWNDPNGFLDEFKPGVTLDSNDLLNYGTGQGATYQFLAKYCPVFAVMTTAIGLRKHRSHWGPINRKEAELVTAAEDYLRQVQILLNTQPIAASGTPAQSRVADGMKDQPRDPAPISQEKTMVGVTQDQFLAIVRALLQLAGGMLISGGYATDASWAQATGALMILAGMGWSLWQHNRTQTIAAAAKLPEVEKVIAKPEIANEGPLASNPKVTDK